jgi:hypothetical protein
MVKKFSDNFVLLFIIWDGLKFSDVVLQVSSSCRRQK